MKLKPVDSEMLTYAGYDPKSRTLKVIFRTGGAYQYKDVPRHKYDELMSAESIGQYMHKHIIGRHDYDRVSQGTNLISGSAPGLSVVARRRD